MSGLEYEYLLNEISGVDGKFKDAAQFFNDNNFKTVRNNINSAIDLFLETEHGRNLKEPFLGYLSKYKTFEIKSKEDVEMIVTALNVASELSKCSNT